MLLGLGGAGLGPGKIDWEGRDGRNGDSPTLLLVKLVSHVLRELAELAFGLGVVGVDHEILEVPEAPAEVLEPLALLEKAGDFGADLHDTSGQYTSLRDSQRHDVPSMSLSTSLHHPSCSKERTPCSPGAKQLHEPVD